MTMFQTQYYPAVAASFTLFLSFFLYASPWLSRRLCSPYREMPYRKQLDWDTRTTSTLHALVVGPWSLYVLLADTALSEDPVWNDSFAAKLCIAVTVGYTITDVVALTVYFRYIGDMAFLLHHFGTLYAFTYVLSYGTLPYFAVFRLFCELSTPFVNNRWFLDAVSYPRMSKAFVGNGLLMTASFFLVRIAVIPIYWYKVYLVLGTEPYHRLGFGAQFCWISVCLVLDILNVIWFRKMLRGAQKLLKTDDRRDAAKDLNKNISRDQPQNHPTQTHNANGKTHKTE
ncbi:PREDICTED: transmembrane protein 56-B-like [Branchiostoma belcheri]|uniref:Transmembrane protein 56-B-like n=1 Tax=Branchiostoma belcheri TaxID=7741 RepID=A0A6P5AJP2_BRABE|nr:PREDICTED: transmembrane protein 56-B-like [Branchiostoma belcheri]